eukprot:9466785-Pyramimonas_sp.AAC.1
MQEIPPLHPPARRRAVKSAMIRALKHVVIENLPIHINPNKKMIGDQGIASIHRVVDLADKSNHTLGRTVIKIGSWSSRGWKRGRT